MNTFDSELRRIRERKELTQAAFSKQLGMNPSTYHAVEAGTMSAQTNSAKRIVQSNVLSSEDKQSLKKYSEKDLQAKVNITDAQRMEYRRRKNAKYFKERAKSKSNNNTEFKRAVSKSATQRMLY